ncbi:MAG: FAD-dependent oxidoreductase [Kofleriaceae bacterium]
MAHDVVIVGAGLAGLALADRLTQAGRDALLVEARPRLGGRIDALVVDGAAFDLGPAWFWPGQPRMAALAARLGATVFEQHAAGAQLHEDERGRVTRGRGFASMAGSLRIDGGMATLVDRLAAVVPPARVRRGAPVVRVEAPGRVILADGDRLDARHVVLALPPRVAATLAFAPALAPEVHAALAAIPTWMGGQAKFVAVYDAPFWRADGLSGDATSRRGPLVEIHDASTVTGQPAALFGFVGVPATRRAGHGAAVVAAAVDQLARLFGPAAARPRQTALADWATAPETAGALDLQPTTAHPDYGLPAALAGLWAGRLHLGSTETAATFGGYLEGALERAEAVAATLADG